MMPIPAVDLLDFVTVQTLGLVSLVERATFRWCLLGNTYLTPVGLLEGDGGVIAEVMERAGMLSC